MARGLEATYFWPIRVYVSPLSLSIFVNVVPGPSAPPDGASNYLVGATAVLIHVGRLITQKVTIKRRTHGRAGKP